MGLGLEMISGAFTAPGVASFKALVAAAGNSLTVRNTNNPTSRIFLMHMWAFNNVAGQFRIRSPKMHDNVRGISYRVAASDPVPFFPNGGLQKMYPQDTLIAEITGSAVGGNIEQGQWLLWYEDIGGISARLANWADIMNRIVNIVTVPIVLAAGAGGGYTGAVALNSTADLLIANTDYALLGGVVDTVCGAVQITGADTGNLGVGFPGILSDRSITADYFKRLNVLTGLPTIPIINSANKAGTNVAVVQNQGAAAVNCDLTLAQLAPK